MRCRSICIAFLLVLFLVVSAGTLSAETTSEKYARITTELTEISKTFNETLINSQLTLMDLQEILPALQTRVRELESEVQALVSDSQLLTEQSSQLLQKWINLKTGIDKVSDSVKTLDLSLQSLDDSIEKAQFKSNLGLGLSIVAGILGAVALGYSIYKGSE